MIRNNFLLEYQFRRLEEREKEKKEKEKGISIAVSQNRVAEYFLVFKLATFTKPGSSCSDLTGTLCFVTMPFLNSFIVSLISLHLISSILTNC